MVISHDDGALKNVENEDRYTGIIVWLIDVRQKDITNLCHNINIYLLIGFCKCRVKNHP